MNDNTLIWIFIGVFAVLGLYVIPRFMLNRAIAKVIKIFREQNVINIKSARTLEELGLKPRTIVDTLFKGRDYKQYAVQLLSKGEIILMTQDGRVYLSEEKLAQSGLDKPQTPRLY